MRKLIAALVTLVMAFGVFALGVSANGISTYDLKSDRKSSLLSISSSTATCKSDYKTTTAIASVTVEQTLEKHVVLGIFSAVSDASRSKTENGKSLSMTNTKSGLTSGTYRVKSVFTVTASSGQSETVTVYSSEKTIN